MKTKLVLLCALLSLGACRGHDGRDGSSGKNGSGGAAGGTGPTGPIGPGGPPGITSSIPFTYSGSYSFPVVSAIQTIPGFDLEKGDVINVYVQWQNQPWTQIGSTWVGGMAGSYAVNGNVVSLTTVIGPSAPLVGWVMSGIKNQ